MKRKTLPAILLALLLLCGCAAHPAAENVPESDTLSEAALENTVMESLEPEQIAALEDAVQSASASELAESFAGLTNVSYVMIYNPAKYEKEESPGTRSTGDLSRQIDVSGSRAAAEETPFEYPFLPVAQGEAEAQFPELPAPEAHRAGALMPQDSVGDTHRFYYCPGEDYTREQGVFSCRYSGTHAVVWVLQGGQVLSDETARRYGERFDSEIYDTDVAAFGTPRFAEDGGRIHLLFYPMREHRLGFFSWFDLYASDEWTPEIIQEYGLNVDRPCVHISSLYAGDPTRFDSACGTIAHEFQHLICGTSKLSSVNRTTCPVWFNEAMSGYIETRIDAKSHVTNGHYWALNHSARIRHGQSLFNFATDWEDIGVYGSVALFSDYLAGLSGEGVFHAFHDYWRSKESAAPNVTEGLWKSIPPVAFWEILHRAPMPGAVISSGENDFFVNSLALSFYLSLFEQEEGCPETFRYADREALLYDSLEPAEIEGGGRIVIATRSGTFSIPKDADRGLVYIGLDSHFRPVTVPIA